MSNRTTAHRRLGPFARALLAVVALAAFMLPMAAAQAHDQLEGTSPADGSTVTAVPARIGLTFNHTPTAIGSEILVKDAAGTNWAEGPVNIVDNHVTQGVKPGAPAGKYTVEWRIVSSDSHPVEGTFSFTATGGASAPAAASGPTASAVAAEGSSGPAVPWGIIGGAAGILVVIVAGLSIARRQLSKDTD
ncbi:copper resistance CopC family protein [Arthrobacter sp. STN4]|uniref:copper resistance CopC family protein n=1 Tax=Arthrobacter sp. STN4 TaxID=2923276 RepID=UPI00211A4352|nr:copper resistance CopC family protein [Arthrobacter sp. STN4]MCQ9164901.1 copper resistance protein CopC [Arthrobacter sp. STN4]